MADENESRCVGCGFLAWRFFNVATSPWLEVTETQRRSGARPDNRLDSLPKCYRGVTGPEEACKLLREQKVGKEESFRMVIALPLACEKYYPYTPNKDPAEHEPMQHAAEVARIQAESHRNDMDRADRRQDKTWEREDIKEAKAREFQKDMTTIQQNFQREATEVQQSFQRETTEKQQSFQRELTDKQGRRETIRWVVATVVTIITAVAGFFGGKHLSTPTPVTFAVPTSVITPASK